VQERTDRVRIAIAHRLEAALLKFEDSVLGHTRLPLACLRKRSPRAHGSIHPPPSSPERAGDDMSGHCLRVAAFSTYGLSRKPIETRERKTH
jgi:hypothetical protein